MSKAAAARKVAVAAAFGGGGIGVVGGSLYGVIRTQAKLARRRIQTVPRNQPPDPSGLYGGLIPRRHVRLAVLGDSAAAGYGARVSGETFGAYLATGLSRLAGRPVNLTSVAVVGARSGGLDAQVKLVLPRRPEVAVIVVGANDVTGGVRPDIAVGQLRHAVDQLRAHGIHVVVGTCPDLGTVRPIMPPLRQLCRVLSRRLAAAQTIATVESGGTTVSLSTLLGSEFAAAPAVMFGPDRFHPSPEGYRSAAAAMLPTVAAAIGVLPHDETVPEPDRGDGIRSLEHAAAAAAESAGTEVGAVEGPGTDGASPVTYGRFGFLRHRRRHRLPDTAEAPQRDASA